MTLMACTWNLQAQTRTYHGTVLDAANGEPLIGATVMPIGGGQGTAADIEGNFTLSVPSSVKKAKVSYVGYESQTVDLKDGIVVKLVSSAASLDDVVVVAYGTSTKESLTGSVAVVGAKEIEDRPVTSVTSALEGNAPGVQVNNSTGQPGSSPSIRIRGFNSFNSNAMSPLYVVDGIVYDGGIADLNPADVESMTVLKDAASCALYGNRGANGVILITTKKAKGNGKVEVTLQVRQGMYNRGLPFYDTLGVNDWMETSLLAYARGRVTSGSYPDLQTSLEQSGPNFLTAWALGTNIFDKQSNEVFSPEGKLVANVLPGYNDLDWWDAVSRSGYRQEYNVNMTGATDKFNVFASAGYLKENGYMLATDFERFNGRVQANFEPVKYLRLGTNISASYQESEQGDADPDELNSTSNPFLTMFYAPILPYYAHDAEGNVIYENGSPVWYTDGLAKDNNIAWLTRLNKNDYKAMTVNGTLYGTAVIPYGFELTVKGSIYRTKETGTEYLNKLIGAQKGTGGIDFIATNVYSHTFMQTLTWNHDFGMHHVDVLLDHENYQYSMEQYFLRKSGQLLDFSTGLSNFENNDASQESAAEFRTESYLGRVRYNYDQKYFGEFSVRRDGSSKFIGDNHWGTFWSVGASWIITREKFMQNVNWMNYLKLRAAYGSVGNDAAAGAYAGYSIFIQHNYSNVGNLLPYTLGNPNIKWEATKTLDLALEGSLFNDRLTFSVGYFDKRNSDLLYNVTQPLSGGTVGFGTLGANPSILQNIGTMANRGWEIQVGVDIIRNNNLKWNFTADASFIKNKVIKLPKGQDIPGQALFQGKSVYEKYTYEWAGVDLTTGNSLYSMEPNSPDYYSYNEAGELVYDQEDWDNTLMAAKTSGHYFEIDGKPYTDRVTYAKRKIMGSALPTVYGSFGTNLSWKGINLGLLFTYSIGGKTYNSNYAQLMSISSTSGAQAIHKDALKAWTGVPEGVGAPQVETVKIPAGTNSAGETVYRDGTVITLQPSQVDPNGVPVLDAQLSQYNDVTSSRFLVNSSYLSMKNINVSYDFPKKWVTPMQLQNLNLGFSVDNLFLITKQKGLNPQYSYSGGQGAYYVPSRVFSFQLTAKF